MRLDDYLQIVEQHAPGYDRSVAIKLYNTLVKNKAVLNDETIKELIISHTPVGGTITIRSILEQMQPVSDQKITTATKWCRQHGIDIIESIYGPCLTLDSGAALRASLENAVPVEFEFDCFCTSMGFSSTPALFANFLTSNRSVLFKSRYHPFVTGNYFWQTSRSELIILFQNWYAEYSASTPSAQKGLLSIYECAECLGVAPKKMFAWLRTHKDNCVICDGRWLVTVAFADTLRQHWSDVMRISDLFPRLLEQIPSSMRSQVKSTVISRIQETQPSWLLAEDTYPQQKAGVLYTAQSPIATHTINEIIQAIPVLPLTHLKAITNMTISSLRNKAASGAIDAKETETGICISIDEYNRVMEINHQYIALDDIAQECLLDHPSKFELRKQSDRNNLITFCDSNDWWGADALLSKELPINEKKTGYVIASEDADFIEGHISLWLQRYKQDYETQFALLIGACAEKLPDTVKMLRKYEQQVHPADPALVDMTELLLASITTELCNMAESTIESVLVEPFANKATLVACDTLSDFLHFGQYTKHKFFFARSGATIDTRAYPVKDFAVMVACIVNESVIAQKELVEKAIEKKEYADLWLYIALHVFASWRSTDYIRMHPPVLPYAPELILEQIRTKQQSPESMRGIAEYFIAINKLRINKPTKTAGTSGVPPLYFYCPQDCLEVFGLILAIATVHHMMADQPGSFVVPVRNWLTISRFFGSDFLAACGNCNFSGRRANKALLQSIEITGREDDQLPPLVAYHLASIMRSHKFAYGQLSQTTDIYLHDANFSGHTPEYIAYQMWNRGVCSFVVDAMMGICYTDKYNKLSVAQKTDVISNLGLSPSTIAYLLRCVQEAEDRACEIVAAVCQDPATVQKALQSLAFGHGTGKDPESYCISKAAGKPCLCKDRLSCMGCNYEIKTKALLLRYAVIHHQLCMQGPNMTALEIAKYRHLRDTMTFPAIAEIVTHLDSITTKSELALYKNLIEEELTYGITDGSTS